MRRLAEFSMFPRGYARNPEIELTAEKVEDAGRDANIVIEKPPCRRTTQSWTANRSRLASPRHRHASFRSSVESAQSRASSSSVGSSGQFHRMVALSGIHDGREAWRGVSHIHSVRFVRDPPPTLRPRTACRLPWHPATRGPADWPVAPDCRDSDANSSGQKCASIAEESPALARSWPAVPSVDEASV
jgi:hypothetical protein